MTPIIVFIAGATLGAVASYLALRNNPRAKAKLDAATDKAELRIDQIGN